MITLAINTASSVSAIALLEGGFSLSIDSASAGRSQAPAVLAETSWPSANDEAAKLMPAIDAMLREAGKDFADIDGILAVRGPGSFTGLRIGVTTANTMSYLLVCKLYGLTTFEYWHALSDLPVLVFAGKGGVYLSIAGEEPEQLTLEELPEVLSKRGISKVCGDISEDQKSRLGRAKFIDLGINFGEACLKILNTNNQSLTPVTTIEPMYVKAPSITESKRKF